MIPRLTAEGGSFKGAALYYLHDKRGEGEAERLTADRVAWTYAINLHTQDPERAWKRMVATANSQADLKRAAGIKATGRKLQKPVMAYSLSWKPGQTPAPHEMLAAAQSSLAALGLDQHQVLVVCHNDTAHPHVHVIVNRVSPIDGVAHKGSVSKLKLSTWAEAYEREQGQILCTERVVNNARRNARRTDRTAEPASRTKQRSRPEWEAGFYDAGYAADVAELLEAEFGEQAGVERAGQARRWAELSTFFAERRAGRASIRDRYQAALDGRGDPAAPNRAARIADVLLAGDPALSLQELTRARSTFTRQDLARHVGRHTHTVDEFQAVLAKLEASPDLVALPPDGQGRPRFTTREMQAVEQRMGELARTLAAERHRDVRPLWAKGISLSRDQNEALKHVLAPTRLASIVGYAGSGKSTLLGAAKRSFEAAGYTVHGMALSGIAADGLKNGAGIDSRTIHSRLLQWERGEAKLTPKDVLVLDEAGMIGSRLLERVLHYAKEGGAKVVMVGDPEQLQAIDAGGAFRAIVARHGAVELTTVRRQKLDWQQEATRQLATGHTDAALARYEAAGMVHAHDEDGRAKDAIIAAWQRVRQEQPRASQMILAYLRADVRDLNDRARAALREAGELGPDVSLKTEAGRRDFAAGDRIYFLRNDAGLGVRNGSLATIVEIRNQTIVARLDGEEGRRVMFGIRQYGHIDHGYAATIHKSQGVTVDRAHLLASRNLDRHASYVAMTRHRDRLDVHWSKEALKSRDRLTRVMSREAVKDTTLDYAPAEAAPPPKVVGRHRARFMSSAAAMLPPGFATKPADTVRDGLAKLQLRAAEQAAQRITAAKLRQLRRDAVASLHRPAAPPETTLPAEPGRATIARTAEITAFDVQTADLAQGMKERHWLEIGLERQQREDRTRAAVHAWEEVRTAAAERHLEETQGHPVDDDAPRQRSRGVSRTFDL